MTRRGGEFREMVREQIAYRGLLYQMTYRDLLLRYKQTVMGAGWAVFMPLVNTAVFSVVFTRVAPIDVGMPYPVFAFSGLVAWNFFSSSLKSAINSLTGNAGLVTKVYFPREIFPVSSVLVAAVDTAVAAVVLLLLMLWYGVPVQATALLLPVVFLVQVLFTIAMSLVLSMANLFYRDVKYLFDVVLTVWMFATSVLYPVGLAGGTLATVMRLNPLTPMVDAYRDVLIRGVLPDAAFGYAAVLAAVTFIGAWFAFHRAEFLFAENL